MTVKKIYGVANVKQVCAGTDVTQDVRVTEQENGVKLVLSSSSYPALLTPDEARHLASVLNEAADRCDKKDASK